MPAWPPYPPCTTCTCNFLGCMCCEDIACCSHGHKYRWPELVGRKQAEAEAIIRRDNPEVTVLIQPPGIGRFFDFCCNRLYIVVDGNGTVTETPVIG
ncbi:hypothetical protein like AT3G46860 [Hibiscus trionum]|uniref:Uncharacterized protein n=1 Tax=Hibiscus trionum TaxID=183268 RepID=A0A9W7HSB4_HIBTR|nr:hypothetical protein like AT3G46860 [Hibiscus trionum]